MLIIPVYIITCSGTCIFLQDIWSEDSRVVPFMADIMEYAEKMTQDSLVDVLKRIARELSSVTISINL